MSRFDRGPLSDLLIWHLCYTVSESIYSRSKSKMLKLNLLSCSTKSVVGFFFIITNIYNYQLQFCFKKYVKHTVNIWKIINHNELYHSSFQSLNLYGWTELQQRWKTNRLGLCHYLFHSPFLFLCSSQNVSSCISGGNFGNTLQ